MAKARIRPTTIHLRYFRTEGSSPLLRCNIFFSDSFFGFGSRLLYSKTVSDASASPAIGPCGLWAILPNREPKNRESWP
jgi:hypothetical protein